MRSANCSIMLAPGEGDDITNMYYDTANKFNQLLEMLAAKMNNNGGRSEYQTSAAPHTTSATPVRERITNATHTLVDWFGDKAAYVANVISPGAGKRFENIIHSGVVATEKVADSIIDKGLEEIAELAEHDVHVSPKVVNWIGDQVVHLTNYLSPGMGDRLEDTIHAGVEMVDEVAEYAVNAGLDAVAELLTDHPQQQTKLEFRQPEQVNQQFQTHSAPLKTKSGLPHGQDRPNSSFFQSSSYGDTYGYNDPYGYGYTYGYNDPYGYGYTYGYNDPYGYDYAYGYNDTYGYGYNDGYNDSPNNQRGKNSCYTSQAELNDEVRQCLKKAGDLVNVFDNSLFQNKDFCVYSQM